MVIPLGDLPACLAVVWVELRMCLAQALRSRRQAQGLTQVELARLIKSSQSRVAKMEAGDPSVSLDLLVRSLLVLSASLTEVAQAIAQAQA